MGKAKKTRKISVKRMVKADDQRIKKNQDKPKETEEDKELVRAVPQVSIQKKIDIVRGMMDCLLAKCIPVVTDCVIAELEKLGHKYRIALTLAKDPRIKRLKCSHKGTYADDCIVSRVMQNKCYIVATNDADLKRRIRKVPGIPIMSVGGHSYVIERLPDVF